MKKFALILVVSTLLFASKAHSQSIGFSYFFPKNGFFSNPVAPVNFSLPVKMGKFFQISPGIGLYHIGGMSIKGFPDHYNSERALVGPFQSLELTLLPALVIPFKTAKIDFVGGVFGFLGFNEKFIRSEFNDMMAVAYNFSFMDTNIACKNYGFGWGYIYGIKFSFKVTKDAWGYIGANYYHGGQNLKISGQYKAADFDDVVYTGNFSYDETAILYQGLQISVGAILK